MRPFIPRKSDDERLNKISIADELSVMIEFVIGKKLKCSRLKQSLYFSLVHWKSISFYNKHISTDALSLSCFFGLHQYQWPWGLRRPVAIKSLWTTNTNWENGFRKTLWQMNWKTIPVLSRSPPRIFNHGEFRMLHKGLRLPIHVNVLAAAAVSWGNDGGGISEPTKGEDEDDKSEFHDGMRVHDWSEYCTKERLNLIYICSVPENWNLQPYLSGRNLGDYLSNFWFFNWRSRSLGLFIALMILISLFLL